MTDPRWGELVRFGLIGLVNTGIYYAGFRLLHLALPYLAAHLIAFAVGVVVSFFLNCRFTFHVRPTLARFVRFPLANLTTLVVMTVAVSGLVEVLRVEPDVAALVAAIATVPITFVVSRLLVVGHLRRSTPEPAEADGVSPPA